MAAIPSGKGDQTNCYTAKPPYGGDALTSAATADTVEIDPGITDATLLPFIRPLTLKEKRQRTSNYFKSFGRKKRG